MKLKLASDEDRDKYWRIAFAWRDQQEWAYYQPDKFAAAKGVAEFLANQNGETCFESYVGREYVL
jgi:hypothetical protein